MKLSRRQLRRLLFKEANHIVSEGKGADQLSNFYQKFLSALSEDEKKDDKYSALIDFMSGVTVSMRELEDRNPPETP